MDTTPKASLDADIPEDTSSSHTGLTSDVFPKVPPPSEENSHTGVSTRNAPAAKEQWYVLRSTYGREKKAYEFLVAHGCTAFYPTITIEKIMNGKITHVEGSRFPNLFFAYGTEEAIKSFVYDNHNLPFLRFYYKHTHVGTRIEKTPLIVPDSQISSLQIICSQEANHDVLILTEKITKFQAGEKVRVTQGTFAGVEGVVARYQGQQRVGIVVDGLLTAITAYVPGAFLEEISDSL